MFDWRSDSTHLSDRELIMLHDGELSSRLAKQGRRHLESCWACRYRSEELLETIFSFVEYCDDLTAQNSPSSSMDQEFHRRLREQVAQINSKSRRFPWLHERLRLVLQPRVLTTLTVIGCLLYLSFNDQLLPVARANEALRNAERHESEGLQKLSGSVIHQQLNLSSRDKNLECDLWRTASGTETRSVCNGDAQFKTDLLRIYEVNAWDTSRPMSPTGFLGWRTKVNASLAEFHRDETRDAVMIRYRVPQPDRQKIGTIREASITLANRTGRSLEQSLRVHMEEGERELKFREVSYDIVAYRNTPFFVPSDSALEQPQQLRRLPLPPMTLAEAPSINQGDLENAEAQLWFVLHQLRADTEMTPEISRKGNRIVLRMLVESEQIQNTIVAAASSIPLVDVEVWTPENAPPTFRLSNTDVPAPSGRGVMYRSHAPMFDELSRCLKSPGNAENSIDQVHHSIRNMMVPALALQRLSRRYTEERYQNVPEASRARLDAIAQDYLVAIQKHSIELSDRLLPILNCWSNTQDHLTLSQPQLGSTWRIAGLQLEQQVRELDSTFGQLFTTRESTNAPLSSTDAIAKITALCAELNGIEPRSFQNPSAADSRSGKK